MMAWVFTGTSISALRKSRELLVLCFSFHETFLVYFLSLLLGLNHSFKSKCREKAFFLHKSENANSAKLFFFGCFAQHGRLVTWLHPSN